MTATMPERHNVRTLSESAVEQALEDLLAARGIDFEELEAKGAAWELDAAGRTDLAMAKHYRFLLSRCHPQ